MAKKKNKKTKGGAQLDTTVEIRLPPRLFTIVDHLRQDPARRKFLNQTIRAVFDNVETFGVDFMYLRAAHFTKAELAKAKKTGKDPDDGHIKLCEGP